MSDVLTHISGNHGETQRLLFFIIERSISQRGDNSRLGLHVEVKRSFALQKRISAQNKLEPTRKKYY